MKYNRIKVGDNFSIEYGVHGWVLNSHYIGKDNKGEPKIRSKQTYHGNLGQVMDAILERQAGMQTSIEGIKGMLKEASESLAKEVGVLFT